MNILLETNDPKNIINLIQSILEEEFFNLISMYECNVKEMDYWIKSQIIDRLSNSSINFNNDRFSESGGNFINDCIRIFINHLSDFEEEYHYIVVENEKYVDQAPELLHKYKECYLDYNEAFKLFESWGYNYIKKLL